MPYIIMVPFLDKEHLNQIERSIAMFLPHGMIATLHSIGPGIFFKFFGTDAQRAHYWQALKAPWWGPSHPGYNKVMSDPGKAIPLTTYGDDGAFKKGLIRLSMLVFSLSSPLSVGSSTQSSLLLLFALLLKDLAADTLDVVFDIMRWSLQAVWEGLWPQHDRHGHQLPPKHQKSGTLAGGYFGLVVQHLGDWKFIKETYNLVHNYSSQSCCHSCLASKRIGVGNFSHFTAAAIAWFLANLRDTSDYLASFQLQQPPPMARVFGFDLLQLLVGFIKTKIIIVHKKH